MIPTGENRNDKKKMSQCHFVHQKSHMNTDLLLSHGPRVERPAPWHSLYCKKLYFV